MKGIKEMEDMHEGPPTSEGAEETAPSGEETPLDSEHHAALELMEEICAATGQEVRPVVRSIQPPYL